jgi:hypothetical protein
MHDNEFSFDFSPLGAAGPVYFIPAQAAPAAGFYRVAAAS